MFARLIHQLLIVWGVRSQSRGIPAPPDQSTDPILGFLFVLVTPELILV